MYIASSQLVYTGTYKQQYTDCVLGQIYQLNITILILYICVVMHVNLWSII